MRIFITGATGYIGNAVAADLARAGHEVYGLARSTDKGRRLLAAEITPVIGEMAHPETYLEAAGKCQVLIHCAAEYTAQNAELDRRTVTELLKLANDSRQPHLFVYTSGVWVYGSTGLTAADESTPLKPPAVVSERTQTEGVIVAANSDLARTIILRPGCVYGGAGGLTASWFQSAEKEGAARIVGDGNFRWSMVHVADLAEGYRLAVESSYGGEIFNLTDRSRFTVLECAKAASVAVTGREAVAITSLQDAAKALGAMAECFAFDQHIDSSKAVRMLGWQPRHGGFVDGAARYYQAWKAI